MESFSEELVATAKADGMYLFRFELHHKGRRHVNVSASDAITDEQRKRFLEWFGSVVEANWGDAIEAD